MKIKEVVFFNQAIDKAYSKQNVTVGMCILGLVEDFGKFTGCMRTQRENKTPYNEQDIESLIHLQMSISLLYHFLKRGCGMISDKSTLKMLEGAYGAVIKEYSDCDLVWLLFRIEHALGELAGKFNIRTQPAEYQYLAQTLMKIQAYLMLYSDKILGKSSPDITDIIKRVVEGRLNTSIKTIVPVLSGDYNIEDTPEIKIPSGLPTPNFNNPDVEKSYSTAPDPNSPPLPPQFEQPENKETELPLPDIKPGKPEQLNPGVKQAPQPSPTPIVKKPSEVENILNDLFPESNIEAQPQHQTKPVVKHDTEHTLGKSKGFVPPPLPDTNFLEKIKEVMGLKDDGKVVGKYDPKVDGDLDI